MSPRLLPTKAEQGHRAEPPDADGAGAFSVDWQIDPAGPHAVEPAAPHRLHLVPDASDRIRRLAAPTEAASRGAHPAASPELPGRRSFPKHAEGA